MTGKGRQQGVVAVQYAYVATLGVLTTTPWDTPEIFAGVLLSVRPKLLLFLDEVRMFSFSFLL